MACQNGAKQIISAIHIFSKVSVHCKGRTVFTREQQSSVFKTAYEELLVHLTTLRSHGNFKAALVSAGCVRKIHYIQKPWSFELKKRGSGTVATGMKESVHSPRPAILYFDDSWRVRGHGSIDFHRSYPGGRK